MVGHRVEVWWPGENQHYQGQVTAFDERRGEHTIKYDDDDPNEERMWLAIESYVDLGRPLLHHNSEGSTVIADMVLHTVRC